MIPITTVLWLVITHFIGDFCLQSNWMGLNKSKEMKPLILHTIIYSTCFVPFGPMFVLVTCLTHTLTDFITSRIGAKLWYIDLVDHPVAIPVDEDTLRYYQYAAEVDMKKRWPFWWMIGFDQTIHLVTLLVTWRLIYGA